MSDLISRQAAIDALKAHEDYKGYLHGDFEEILEALPSVQPESSQCWGCNCPKMQKTFSESDFSEEKDAWMQKN